MSGGWEAIAAVGRAGSALTLVVDFHTSVVELAVVGTSLKRVGCKAGQLYAIFEPEAAAQSVAVALEVVISRAVAVGRIRAKIALVVRGRHGTVGRHGYRITIA